MSPPQGLSLAAIAASPRWFPHLLDPVHDRVLLVEKSEAEYRAASFLDDRSLIQERPRHIVEWRSLDAAAEAAHRQDVQYIFHIGHVGSTLVSRLLGEIPAFFALREPQILRTFAEMLAERGRCETCWDPESIPSRAATLATLLSRTFTPQQRALVKATSFTSEIAPDLVPPGSRALLLYSRADRYVENILAGDNSRQEVRMTAATRLTRLHRRTGADRWKLWTLSEGELVAMSWATEMTSLAAAEAALPAGATMWMEFDDFLAAPAESLSAAAAFFCAPIDAASAEGLARHPLMGRYSKAPEHEYSPALRRELLAQARREHAPAVAAAHAWLAAAAREVPVIARCLDGPGRSR